MKEKRMQIKSFVEEASSEHFYSYILIPENHPMFGHAYYNTDSIFRDHTVVRWSGPASTDIRTKVYGDSYWYIKSLLKVEDEESAIKLTDQFKFEMIKIWAIEERKNERKKKEKQ